MSAHKISQLEGVRAIGALIVFVCHFQIIIAPDFYDHFYKFLYPHLGHTRTNFIVLSSNLMINGNLVLHLFWALSAYVIFKNFFQHGATGSKLLASSAKRYFRLMLPCAVSIFFSYAIYKGGLIYVRKIGVETLQQNLYLIPPSFFHALKTSVWNTLFNYDYYDSYNGPLWTIQREFYGSIFCFALFGLTGRTYRRGLIYLTIFIVVGMLKMYWLNSFLFGYYLSDYDFTPTNSEQVKKIINKVNDFITRHQWLIVGMVLIVFGICKMIIYKRLGWMDMVNSFLCSLVILVTFRVAPITRLLGHKALTLLGKVSFGIYLLHWPIMCSFTSWLYLRHTDHSTGFITLLFSLSLALTLLLSWLFYKFVDMPSIALAGNIGKKFSDYIIVDKDPVAEQNQIL
ncbi:hypothetical protein CJD36_012320 [Flavipsychrobacter stenotrophus]|uniref:Acyltransferase 3 domain-containing protein n=1 Tax=Flavipsychrobacter stenotrophus TaxID=2077091 RepID=A0A2S7SV00_9BACT|nr:acyltransferase [Flavipsychrobacter stenotrophus]PQJ10749.1 hypothetical protein CJD36_012320 [Flavipsychrobacter stenotrophus]